MADTNVTDQFYMAGSHFVTFEPDVLPSNKVLSWFKAPAQEEEYISGGDETWILIDKLSDVNVSNTIAERGYEYYRENKVRYICVDGNRGYALVEGGEVYEVEFEYRNREVCNLVCYCYCSYNCKHEFAAMLQIRETLDVIEKHYQDEVQKTGYFATVAKGTLFTFVVDKKETGKFVL